jgi:hypothetical protein
MPDMNEYEEGFEKLEHLCRELENKKEWALLKEAERAKAIYFDLLNDYEDATAFA